MKKPPTVQDKTPRKASTKDQTHITSVADGPYEQKKKALTKDRLSSAKQFKQIKKPQVLPDRSKVEEDDFNTFGER